MIADTVRIEERGLAFGFHRAMDHTGAVIGPLIGYLLVLAFAVDRNAPTAADFKRFFWWLRFRRSQPCWWLRSLCANRINQTDTADRNTLQPQLRLSLRGFDGNFKRFL